MDPRSRLRKTSRWFTEERVQKVMAINRKEESVLQQKLDQFQREQNQLRRKYDYEIRKTAQALNARKELPQALNARKEPPRTAEDSKTCLRRNSSPFMEPTNMTKAKINARRRHSIACPPPSRTEKEDDSKKANEDVLFEIENNFKFLSIAFGKQPSTPTSFNVVKLPEIKPNSAQGPGLKPAFMRRRHSDVTSLRHGMQKLYGENRRSSLANIHERFG